MRRVLVQGFGSIGRRHCRVIRALHPDIELAVLSEHGSHADSPVPAHRLFTRLEDAVAFQPQAVVVANAAVAHVASIEHWIRAGSHVLVEKPLATSALGLAELGEWVARSGLTLQVGYNLRQMSGLRLMRDWLRQGRLGRIHSARVEVGQNLANWRAGGDPLRSVSASRALGGGVLLELSHEIDYLQWLLGPAVWVSAQLSRQGAWDIDVEDTALLTLGLGDQGNCVAALQMDFLRHDTTRRCTLIGELGSLQWDAPAGRVSWWACDATGWETVEEVPAERDATYRLQWLSFIASCETGAAPAVDLEDGVSTLRVVDAARRSNDVGGGRTRVDDFRGSTR